MSVQVWISFQHFILGTLNAVKYLRVAVVASIASLPQGLCLPFHHSHFFHLFCFVQSLLRSRISEAPCVWGGVQGESLSIILLTNSSSAAFLVPPPITFSNIFRFFAALSSLGSSFLSIHFNKMSWILSVGDNQTAQLNTLLSL